eukprot:1157291-Pelagomonas_calceolata.AAC.2
MLSKRAAGLFAEEHLASKFTPSPSSGHPEELQPWNPKRCRCHLCQGSCRGSKNAMKVCFSRRNMPQVMFSLPKTPFPMAPNCHHRVRSFAVGMEAFSTLKPFLVNGKKVGHFKPESNSKTATSMLHQFELWHGNIPCRFVEHLSHYPSVFHVSESQVSLASELDTPEKRTAQVARKFSPVNTVFNV